MTKISPVQQHHDTEPNFMAEEKQPLSPPPAPRGTRQGRSEPKSPEKHHEKQKKHKKGHSPRKTTHALSNEDNTSKMEDPDSTTSATLAPTKDEEDGGIELQDTSSHLIMGDEEEDIADKATKGKNDDDDDEDDDEEEGEEMSMEDHASAVVTILKPVCITMLIVVFLVRTLNIPERAGTTTAIVFAYKEDETDSTGTKFLGSLLNAVIFLSIILFTTVIFVILYKYNCIKIIIGWLVASTAMMFAVFGGLLLFLLFDALNTPLDYITYAFLLWNFGICGIVAVFWAAPRLLNQAYLIIVSALLAVFFTRLPEWTTWSILIIVAIYDLFAVLCPKGPLKVLVETAQQRKEPIPALLYNASAVLMMADTDESTENKGGKDHSETLEKEKEDGKDWYLKEMQKDIAEAREIAEIPQNASNSSPEAGPTKHRGVKLGLGDFVFYSVLVGRAALFDMLTVITSFVAIITGLFATLILLAVFRRALPALPISIALGVCFYFLSRVFLVPFIISLGMAQAFV